VKAAFLVFDKPAGITSHDVVGMVRAVTGIKKVGHTGTLDPFATGVLPLALGRATRLIQYLDEDLKVYDAVVQLGAATDTGDPTGTVIREAPVPTLDAAAVRSVLESFVGTQMQEPPRYSAVKVKGKPLYAYAREGKDVRAKPREVRIDRVDLLELHADRLRILIECGRGTYARVIAEQVGQALGTEGHLISLRRRRSGPFHEDQALDVVALSEMVAGTPDWRAALRPRRGAERMPWRPRDDVRADLGSRLTRPIDVLSHLPVSLVPAPLQARFLNGGPPPPPPAGTDSGGRYLVVAGEDVIAVAERGPSGGKVRCRLPI